jgi:hypothetical protein
MSAGLANELDFFLALCRHHLSEAAPGRSSASRLPPYIKLSHKSQAFLTLRLNVNSEFCNFRPERHEVVIRGHRNPETSNL